MKLNPTKSLHRIKIAAFVLGCGLCLCSCGSKPDPDPTDDDVIVSDTGIKPDSVVVMIDKSGSMKGYFVDGAAGEVSGLIEYYKNMGNKEGSAKFSDNTPIQKNASQLKNAKNFSADTDFSILLDSITNNAKTDPVVLITDGIVSTQEGKDGQRQIESKIKSILKNNSSLGYSMVRMQVPYNGEYWIESSRGKKYHTEKIDVPNRPIFAIVVGPKANVQYMAEDMNNNKEFKTELLVFNIHSDHTCLQFTPSLDEIYNSEDEGSELIDGKKFRKYSLKDIDYSDGYEYIVNLPECIAEITKKNINQSELKINEKKLTLSRKDFEPDVEKNIWGYSLSGNTLIVKLPTYVISNETEAGENNLITLSYPINPEGAWENYFSDDDSNIKNSDDEQGKTYGLETIVKAMYEADENNDVEIKLLYTN